MKIKIIGSGCPTCTTLYQMVLKLKKENKISAEVEHKKDVNELIDLGVMGSHALVIDGKVVNVGMIESSEKLLELINKFTE
jgi:small redox-active disulfide protein 2